MTPADPPLTPTELNALADLLRRTDILLDWLTARSRVTTHSDQREDQIHVVGVVLSLCKAYVQALRRVIDDPRRMRILRVGLIDLDQSLTRLRLALEAEELTSQMPTVIEPIPDTVTPPRDLPTAIADDLAQYAHALVYQDFDTVGNVLDKASRDPALEQAILDWHRMEEANVQRRDDDTYAGIGDAGERWMTEAEEAE